MTGGEREQRALRAAREVALEHGLEFADAEVIAAGSNVLVRLRPADVVARVMTGTASLHGDDPRLWLEREIGVGIHLRERGAPAVPPSDLLPPGPHDRDGLWITFWEWVDGAEPSAETVDPAELGTSLRRLHEALADYPGDLRPLSEVGGDIEHLLRAVDDHDSHARHAELRRLAQVVFASAPDAQALHGDATIGNTLSTPDGLLWNDFEDVCRGPVEWDVAGLVAAAEVRNRDERFVDAMLDAYGGPNRRVLEPFVETHLLYLRAWKAFEAARGRGAAG